jgi:hypothetical protein
MKHQYLTILFLLLAIAACEDETRICDQTLSTVTRIAFKQDSAGVVRDTVMRQVSLYAIGRDSIYRKTQLNMLFLQLSPVADSSRYHLKVDSISVPDTLLFRYKRTPHFISPGCGFSTFYSLDTIISTHHSVDSIRLNIKEVTSRNDTNIYFYFRRI